MKNSVCLFVFFCWGRGGEGGHISVSVCLMVVPHNMPSVLRAPSARKHPSCFHSHGSPALLTLTSAFMWPGSKANLRAHNMFLNQWLGTDEVLTRIWRYHGPLLRCQHFPFRSARRLRIPLGKLKSKRSGRFRLLKVCV